MWSFFCKLSVCSLAHNLHTLSTNSHNSPTKNCLINEFQVSNLTDNNSNLFSHVSNFPATWLEGKIRISLTNKLSLLTPQNHKLIAWRKKKVTRYPDRIKPLALSLTKSTHHCIDLKSWHNHTRQSTIKRDPHLEHDQTIFFSLPKQIHLSSLQEVTAQTS